MKKFIILILLLSFSNINCQHKKEPLVASENDNFFGFKYIKDSYNSNPWYEGSMQLNGKSYNTKLEKSNYSPWVAQHFIGLLFL